MIPADRIVFHEDGTAWWIPNDDEFGTDVLVENLQDLDRPCDTCDGDCEDGPNLHTPIAWRCPDCIDGRHTFTIDVENSGPCVKRPGQCPPGVRCKNVTPCIDRKPVRSLRVSVVPDIILPIVANSNDWEHGHINHIDMMSTGTILRTNSDGFGQDATSVNLPPAAAPGMWAIQLQTERTEP